MKNEIEGKTKVRFIQSNQWERKEYINEAHGSLASEIIKIRLNMSHVKINYKRDNTDIMCPRCNVQEDTTEHVLLCYSQTDPSQLKNTQIGEWKSIVEAFSKRSMDTITESL